LGILLIGWAREALGTVWVAPGERLLSLEIYQCRDGCAACRDQDPHSNPNLGSRQRGFLAEFWRTRLGVRTALNFENIERPSLATIDRERAERMILSGVKDRLWPQIGRS
jgi:hypothetical protein